jgi:hypothetical protein
MNPPDFAQLAPLPHGVPSWVQGSKVVITGSNDGIFNSWMSGEARVMVAGQPLEDWWLWAADHDRLPSAVCGRVSASALQKQVYGKSAQDPWGS